MFFFKCFLFLFIFFLNSGTVATFGRLLFTKLPDRTSNGAASFPHCQCFASEFILYDVKAKSVTVKSLAQTEVISPQNLSLSIFTLVVVISCIEVLI